MSIPLHHDQPPLQQLSGAADPMTSASFGSAIQRGPSRQAPQRGSASFDLD
jgi:hypothetical protein